MKKIFAILSMMAFIAVSAPTAFAAERGTPEYQKLVELKKQQRAKREAEKANPSSRAKSFWEKEAERSGLAGTGAMLANPGRIIQGGTDSK